MSELVVPLTEATFDREVAKAQQPVLVEFGAEGCGPCAALAPVLERLAAEHAGRLRIAEVRLDNAPGLAARFEIMALPTLIVFIGGVVVKRLTGDAVSSLGRLEAELAEFVAAEDTAATGETTA
jgi:thioredoxin